MIQPRPPGALFRSYHIRILGSRHSDVMGLSGGVVSLELSFFSHSSIACVPARCINNRSLISDRRCWAFASRRVVWSNFTSTVATSIWRCSNLVKPAEPGFEETAQDRNSSKIFSWSSADRRRTVWSSFFIWSICVSKARWSYCQSRQISRDYII